MNTMHFLNRTRQFYQKVLQGRKPTENQVLQSIQNAKDLKNLQKHPGWKVVEDYIARQKEGTSAFMEAETQKGINVIGLAFLFNTFVKYLFFLQENRAYNKIAVFIKTTIERGEENERRLAKQEERKSSQSK